jgi:hypothetical protein
MRASVEQKVQREDKEVGSNEQNHRKDFSMNRSSKRCREKIRKWAATSRSVERRILFAMNW